jgi:transposase
MEIKREDIEAIYDQGKEAMVDFVMNLIQEFTSKIEMLTQRVNELEKRLEKDSHNSSKPPSTDGLKKKQRTKSQRKRSGKKSGGQQGHEGKTLEMSATPDHIVKIKVKICNCCGKPIKGAHKKGYEARQKFEIPAPVVEVTEYQAEITDCPHCGAENRAQFPEGITHKTQYGDYLRSIAVYFRNYQLIPLERNAEIFRDLFNVPLSEGTIIAASARCEEALSGFREWLIDKIMKSRVVNFDETGVNICGSLHWIHTAGTPLLTAYLAHKRRGSEAIDAFDILPGFTGRAVHDHLPVYFKYSCDHGLCNAHHIRELTYMFEHEGQKWSQKMIDCLLEIKESVEKAGEKGKLISPYLMRKYENDYQEILRQGFRKNPRKRVDTVKKRGRPKKTNIQNLLFRLRDYQKETLAFMYDLDVPFDNNLAERDLRMIKVQQKISGLFRTMTGAEQFCKIRSFISTTRKQGLNVIDSIYQIMIGKQIYVDFSYGTAE